MGLSTASAVGATKVKGSNLQSVWERGAISPLTLRRYTIGTPYEFVEEHYKSPVYIFLGRGSLLFFFFLFILRSPMFDI